jgi:hypothetical protein
MLDIANQYEVLAAQAELIEETRRIVQSYPVKPTPLNIAYNRR